MDLNNGCLTIGEEVVKGYKAEDLDHESYGQYLDFRPVTFGICTAKRSELYKVLLKAFVDKTEVEVSETHFSDGLTSVVVASAVVVGVGHLFEHGVFQLETVPS